MIITKLWGGLGNQLFQYSFGYQLAKKLETTMKLDISYYRKQNLRQPIILDLNLEYNEIIPQEELPLIVKILNMKNLNRIIRIPSFTCLSIGSDYKYLKETRFCYNERINKFKESNVYIDGYWQCPRYFEAARNDLISQFKVRNNVSSDMHKLIFEVKKQNSVAIHVRRGDYVNNYNPFSKLVLMNKKYYDNAIEKVYSTLENPRFYFFTNDVEWVRDNYRNLPNSRIISEILPCRDVEELIIMSKCKHQIISNSTFSWWAAWLNESEGKQVWSPSRGFGNIDIIPIIWNRVEI